MTLSGRSPAYGMLCPLHLCAQHAYPSSVWSSEENNSGNSLLTKVFRYFSMPVPAGTTLPMITFSFKPLSSSIWALIAASVSTLVVSWKEAAETPLSVVS